MSIVYFIAACIYFMLPAFFANMVPVAVRKINVLNVPLDFGKKYHGKPLLGKNKTWRGLVFGVVFGLIMFYFQKLLYSNGFFRSISLVDYSAAGFYLGFALSFGALFGDLLKSFVKRRAGITPGEPFYFFDQIDFAVGALFFSFWYLSWQAIAAILIIGPILHVLSRHTAYYLRVTNSKW